MKKTSIILLIVFLITSCSKKSEIYQQLVNADSLLYKNLVDSANNVLKEIEPKTKEDSAYFFVLKAETTYRKQNTPDSNQINFSIKFYENHNDNRKLANAYYYKACTFIRINKISNGVFILLKKAEQLAEKISDDDLKDKIYSGLGYVNYAKNQTEEALKYAYKEYGCAKRLGCRRDIAYALLRLSTMYNDLKQKDSAEYYIMQCKALVKEVDSSDKAFIYNILGYCFMEDNSEAAQKYFQTSLKYKKNSETYKNLAEIYYAKKDTQNWKQYCDSALIDIWYEEKIDILSNIAEKNYNDKNFTAYKQTNDEIIKTMQELYNYEKANYSLEIQKKFDYEKQKAEFNRKTLISFFIFFMLIAVFAIVFLMYRHKLQNIRQINFQLEKDNARLYSEQEKLNVLINNLKVQIDLLKQQKDQLSNESNDWSTVILSYENMITKLESQLNILNNQNVKLLKIGEQIFELIRNNNPISDFKENWANCVFYFECTYPEKIKIFNTYANLNIANKIFIISDSYFKKTDADLSQILGISESTVRSRRTKLKEKLK